MQVATQAQQTNRCPQWGPICCKQQMYEMVRRAILRSNGTVIYCSVWHCLNCGRLLL